ncbi:unnamed protein product [Durusdinium trenchii]
MRWRWPACALTIVTAVSLWLTASQLHVSQSAVPLDQDSSSSSAPDEFIHLCICSDDSDFRPAVVAIRSAVASSRQAHRFVFHLVTTPELSVRFSRAAKLQLPGVRIEVHADEEIQSAIQSRIEFRDTAGRKGLASAFNFAPFYLPLFLTPSSETFTSQTRRLIYFDADIVLLGDLAEVFDMDMEGKPCAAVPYCNQKMQKYVNFNVLKTLVTSETIDPSSCIANRGLLLIDVKAWADLKLTESIEFWLEQYRKADGELWVGGMSQPPWLLAINGNYMQLNADWNCNSLGRHSMGNLEVAQLHSLGFEEDHLTSLRVETTSWGVVPYVVTCSNSAKLLHYNGAMKPWLLDSDTVQVPVCTMPQALSEYHFNWVQEVEILGVTYTFVTCSEIWSLFLADDLLYSEPVNTTAEGVEELQRREDAKTWANKINADREKRQKDKEWREKQLAERRKKLAGGYYTGQTIQAAHDISVRGKIVVRKNCEGVVQGPSLNHPTERLNVLFKERRDKKTRSINVLPFEVKPSDKDKET